MSDDPHLQQAASLLADADQRNHAPIAERQLMVTEALVHAVLHLAAVLEVREIVGGRQ